MCCSMKLQISVFFALIVLSHCQNNYPRSLVVWPLLFEFNTPRLSTGECCAPTTSDTECTEYCRVSLVLDHNDRTNPLVETPYPVKTMIWDNQEIHVARYLDFRTEMEFRLTAISMGQGGIVDVWLIRISMDALTGNVILDNRVGEFGNAKVSVLFKWACPGHYGINCLQRCSISNSNGYCDSNGVVHCKPPFVRPPSCLTHGQPCDDNPCKNGARCQTNPENNLDYNCICSLGFGGKNCDKERCTPESCGEGTCIDGSCVCEAGYHGDNCDSVRCEAGICQNRGICKVEDGKHSCECPNENVLGEFCQHRCRPACLYGTCTINKEGNGAECSCFKGFGGHICDIEIGTGGSDKKVSSSTAVKIAVPIVVILIIAVAAALVYLFVFKKKGMQFKINKTGGSVEEL